MSLGAYRTFFRARQVLEMRNTISMTYEFAKAERLYPSDLPKSMHFKSKEKNKQKTPKPHDPASTSLFP